MRFYEWRETVVSIFFPRHCPVCEEIVQPRGELICPECLKRLEPVKQPVCFKCGKELESDQMELCYDCTRHPRSFERNFALLNYNEAAGNSMISVKYRNRREYLDFYGRALCRRFGHMLIRIRPDLLIPIPIHPSRMRTRGFNQAQVLAEIIGEILKIPVYEGALKRSKKTMPQKELDPQQRLKNLEQAFEPGKLPAGVRTVLLVDDIYTTGSTMEACTRVLKRMGWKLYTELPYVSVR